MPFSVRTKKRFILGAMLGGVMLVGLTAGLGRFSYGSVCRRCGVVQDTTEWQIRYTDFTLFRNSSERDSLVTRVLLRNGLVLQHEHQWSFIQGSGNGVRCAIGEGRHVMPSVESEGVARLIEAAHKFGETGFRDKLLRTVFDPDISREVWGIGLSAPTNDFGSAAELGSWITNNMEFFDEMVASDKERARR